VNSSRRTLGSALIGFAVLLMVMIPACAANADQLAYSCGQDICLINPDNPDQNSNLTQSETASDRAPSWSPDGNLIAFVGSYLGSSDIFTIDPAKTAAEQEAVVISDTPGSSADQGVPPAWSPDGTRLAFSERVNSNAPPNLESEVYVAPRDGSAAPVAIDSTSNKSELTPAWSPDSSTLVFSRDGLLWKGPPDNSAKPTALANSYGYEPVWSPDGSRIATVTFSDPEHVRITNADGSGFKELPFATDFSSTVDWSLDSTQVVYISDEAVDNVRVAPADGSGPGHIIPMPEGWIVPHHPVFSPDGSRVAFDARNGKIVGEQVLVAPSDGSAAAVPITTAGQNNEEPDWKPCEGCAPPAKPPAGNGPEPTKKTPQKIRLATFKNVYIYPRLSVGVDCSAQGGHPDPKYCHGDGIAKAVTYTGSNPRLWAKPKLKKKTIIFAKGSVKVRGGESGQLKLKVTGAGKKLAKPGRTLKIQIVVKVSRDKEKPETFKQTVKVKVPKKKG
jgi:Tol biopolymer transport system component